MADDTYAGIASADYIIDIYVETHDRLLEHERTGSEGAIRRAAAALCHGLTRLADDERFWGSLADVRTSAHAEAAETPLGDLDGLLGLERSVLEKVGVPAHAPATILQEVARELEAFHDFPDEWSVSRLRETVGVNGQFACLSASPVTPDQRSVVRIASSIAAGAVVIVADAIAAVPGITDLSVVVGGRIIGRYALPIRPETRRAALHRRATLQRLSSRTDGRAAVFVRPRPPQPVPDRPNGSTPLRSRRHPLSRSHSAASP